jgi:hypothetical protein
VQPELPGVAVTAPASQRRAAQQRLLLVPVALGRLPRCSPRHARTLLVRPCRAKLPRCARRAVEDQERLVVFFGVVGSIPAPVLREFVGCSAALRATHSSTLRHS